MELWMHWRSLLIILVALGCGLVAGVFFAFSTFVMTALAQIKPSQGIIVMQAINITAINPLFMLALLGTAAGCLGVILSVLFDQQQPGVIYLVVGSLVYLVGTVLVTIACNVPLNNALAVVQPESHEGVTLWARYLTAWTWWNHGRTIAALLAAALFTACLAK
jgi:uncharacterized membrane protein